eukprot:UN09594
MLIRVVLVASESQTPSGVPESPYYELMLLT